MGSRKTHDFDDDDASAVRRRQTQVSSPLVTSALPYFVLNESYSSIPKYDCIVSTSAGDSQTSPSTLQHLPQDVHENCMVLDFCSYHGNVNGRTLDRMRRRMDSELIGKGMK